MTLRRFFPVLVVLTSGFATKASAQERWGADTLTLRSTQQLAAAADPRTRELALHEQATNYRVRNIAAERLPSFGLETQSQYQSDVVTFGLNTNLLNAPRPPKDTYDAFLRIQQSVLDATNQPRRALERAQLVESQARVHSALFALRQEVNTAYFSAAQLQERAAELAIVIGDLAARLEEANVRVRGGTALPSEPAAIKATLL
jgi:outer membrane protein TolC